MVSACSRSDWSAADSSGPRPRVELYASAALSFRCFLRALTGAELSERGQPNTLLPAWNGTDDEGAYNIACGNLGPFLNCDAKNIFYGGGSSQLEFCDLVDLNRKTLFFAKIVSKSSGMSHLIEQVRRTAQLLFSVDDSYRKK